MLIQEKQFLYQQHLGTCVNNLFLYTDLCSLHSSMYFYPLVKIRVGSALRKLGE